MSGSRYVTPYAYAFDGNGDPIVGASLYFYETGTSTPQDTYSDAGLTVPNANPVQSIADGQFPAIFLLQSPSYKVVLEDQNGDQLWTADPVGPNAGSGSSVPSYLIGIIFAYAGASAPSGTAFCYGQPISRTAYPLLFAAIGVSWGVGDGSTTFNLPDLRGNVPAGADAMGGTAAGRLTSASIGVGATLGVLGGGQNLQAHSHTVVDPTHFHTLGVGPNSVAGGSGTVDSPGNISTVNTNAASTGITIAVEGSGGTQNVQPVAVVNYIMFLA